MLVDYLRHLDVYVDRLWRASVTLRCGSQVLIYAKEDNVDAEMAYLWYTTLAWL